MHKGTMDLAATARSENEKGQERELQDPDNRYRGSWLYLVE